MGTMRRLKIETPDPDRLARKLAEFAAELEPDPENPDAYKRQQGAYVLACPDRAVNLAALLVRLERGRVLGLADDEENTI